MSILEGDAMYSRRLWLLGISIGLLCLCGADCSGSPVVRIIKIHISNSRSSTITVKVTQPLSSKPHLFTVTPQSSKNVFPDVNINNFTVSVSEGLSPIGSKSLSINDPDSTTLPKQQVDVSCLPESDGRVLITVNP